MARCEPAGPAIPSVPAHRPELESRSAALVRLGKLFASIDGAVAGGRYDELRGLLGRISLALTMARTGEKNAPAVRVSHAASGRPPSATAARVPAPVQR